MRASTATAAMSQSLKDQGKSRTKLNKEIGESMGSQSLKDQGKSRTKEADEA